ncbi:basic salivary proline-rich protein 2-like [Vulpes lagopus]|uniref:basic salivary proline-rich protein 2-like n=1 Tax=Vulpes lagopus TaxID=494514 RepID=UPI001BC9634B|nr:basic salivary proline-rich protein 2-like [Vulpes lagopus]
MAEALPAPHAPGDPSPPRRRRADRTQLRGAPSGSSRRRGRGRGRGPPGAGPPGAGPQGGGGQRPERAGAASARFHVPGRGAQSGEGRLQARGSLLGLRGSRAEERAGGARSPPRAPDARGPLCAGRAPGPSARGCSLRPAPPSPPRRVRAAGALSEHYKRGAPPRAAPPIGPPQGSRTPVGRQDGRKGSGDTRGRLRPRPRRPAPAPPAKRSDFGRGTPSRAKLSLRSGRRRASPRVLLSEQRPLREAGSQPARAPPRCPQPSRPRSEVFGTGFRLLRAAGPGPKSAGRGMPGSGGAADTGAQASRPRARARPRPPRLPEGGTPAPAAGPPGLLLKKPRRHALTAPSPKVTGSLGATVTNSAQRQRWQEFFTWLLGKCGPEDASDERHATAASADPQRPLAAGRPRLRPEHRGRAPREPTRDPTRAGSPPAPGPEQSLRR